MLRASKKSGSAESRRVHLDVQAWPIEQMQPSGAGPLEFRALAQLLCRGFCVSQ